MCTRVTLASDKKTIAEAFPGVELPDDIPPRYNIAPTDDLYAVTVTDEGTRRLVKLKWGLVPAWARDETVGRKLINARAETVSDKPSFRKPFRDTRCLVVVDGFYEWAAAPDGKTRVPYRFTVEGGVPFALAGIFDNWKGEGGEVSGIELQTCAVITTASNSLVGSVHGRMPVIMSPEDYDAWLDPDMHDKKELAGMLRPYPPERMNCMPVSRKVNNPRNEGPELLEAE